MAEPQDLDEDPALLDDPPGSLVIADRVGAAIAERAALDLAAVVESSSAVGSLVKGAGALKSMVGGVYPSAQIDMSDRSPRLSIQVALSWPCPVTAVCQELRTVLADELERLTGVRPVRVDVDVARLVPRSGATSNKRSRMIAVPSAAAPDADDGPIAADDDAADQPVAGIDDPVEGETPEEVAE
ncbi:MAG: Asp23/Gls24 family envelope stress response protein [Gordonia sp. (in: high G+C Gram-positive bacteria)]